MWVSVAGKRRKPVRVARRPDGVDRHLDVAVRPVLEADRHREPRRELAVDLALHGARADRPPAHEVRVVLAERGVQELRRDGEAHRRYIRHELPGEAQALGRLEGLVQVRVVDQALPAYDCARLLEVHAHGDDEPARVPVRGGLEERCVLLGGCDVVNRARADDDEDALVAPRHDRGDVPSGRRDAGGARVVKGVLPLDHRGGRNGPGRTDAKVGGETVHAGRSRSRPRPFRRR
jgi:hypothetical protein